MSSPEKTAATGEVCHPAEHIRFAEFVADLEGRGRAPKTIDSYRSDWVGLGEWYAAEHGEPFDVSALGVELVEAFRERLVADGMRPATVNRKLVFAKRYAGWAFQRGEVGAGTLAGIKGVKAVPQGPRRPRGLSDIELRRFLKEVERRAGPRDQAIIRMLLDTGMRVSELVALEVEQVTVNGRRGMVLVEDDRAYGMRSRKLSLGPDGRRALKAYLAVRGESSGPLFLGERGPLTANAIQRIMRKYCAFAKVKASPGTLRHTFARSFLAEQGDLVELADLLGHESLETTRLYLRRAGARAEAVDTAEVVVRPRVVGGTASKG